MKRVPKWRGASSCAAHMAMCVSPRLGGSMPTMQLSSARGPAALVGRPATHLQVLVHDAAALKVAVEEVGHHPLSLGHHLEGWRWKKRLAGWLASTRRGRGRPLHTEVVAT